jgi:pimeloyl-ACP methyl ester carboxylesterase
VTLVGHDAGGQIAYAYLRAYPGELEAAVIMNVAVPGVEPWSKVMNDPKRWHFAFHSVPGLPEKLVTPEIAEYFDHFFDALEGPKRVSAEQRKQFVEAYSRPSALQTGFEWHRAFEQDAKDNVALQGQRVKTRVLYVRGECEPVDVDEYLEGFKAAGIEHIDAAVIPNAGHFVPSEQPQELAALIRQFTDRRKRLG